MNQAMEQSLIHQGALLMLAGMGTVFVFLTLLVIAMSAMAAVCARLQPAGDAARDDAARGDEGEIIAAITAAIRQHRSR